jgi:hypothetical protein
MRAARFSHELGQCATVPTTSDAVRSPIGTQFPQLLWARDRRWRARRCPSSGSDVTERAGPVMAGGAALLEWIAGRYVGLSVRASGTPPEGLLQPLHPCRTINVPYEQTAHDFDLDPLAPAVFPVAGRSGLCGGRCGKCVTAHDSVKRAATPIMSGRSWSGGKN